VTTARISAERALEIIAACGADSRRWPADEREAALLCAIADPAVAAALAEARQFDALLADWAGDVVPRTPIEAATLIPAPVARPILSRRQRWWVGGALAGAIAGVVMMPALQMAALSAPPPAIAVNTHSNVSPVPSATGESQDLADAEAFAAVFTPTADEDELI
jgi:hypothetical protein